MIAAVPVEDDLAVRNLFARYAHFADAGDKDAYAGLFLPDGTWTRENASPVSMGGSGFPGQTIQGHEALKKMIEDTIINKFRRLFRHQMTDVLIEPGENCDELVGVCRTLITDWRDGPGKIAMCARYRCVCRRTADGWRFKSVSIHILPSA